MSGFSKKEQDKSLFTVKKDSEGNTVVMRASGKNGGEIRASVLRTNEGKPFIVSGKGINVSSGSNSTGHPKSGQVQINVDLNDIAPELKALISRFGISGTAGPKGPPGATGAQGAQGLQGEPGTPGINGANGVNGSDGSNGVGITNITDNGDGTLTIEYGDPGSTVVTGDLKGEKGDQGDPGVGFVSGDKFVTSLPLFSLAVSHVDTGTSSVADGDKSYGRLIFKNANYENSSMNISWSWEICGHYEHKMQSTSAGTGISSDTTLEFTLQYYDTGTSAWSTFYTAVDPGVIAAGTTGAIELSHSADMTANFAAFALAGLFDDTTFRVSCIVTPGVDDVGEDVEVTVGLRSSRILAVYTVP